MGAFGFGSITHARERVVHRGISRLTTVTLQSIAVCASVLCASAQASAQGTSAIAGVVRDTSGAVLPGVTVEASSPALIEKVRTVVTDSEGQYKILDLPGGTYTVTFSLIGFSTVKREGLELTANFTANVVAEMRVGQLEETITVLGESPVVDVQTTAQHKVVSRELLYSLPLTKEMGGFAKVTVGARIAATAQDVGGNIDPMNGIQECRHSAVAPSQFVGRCKRHRHRRFDPAANAVRGQNPAARSPVRRDFPLLRKACRAGVRHLQRAEREPDPVGE